MQTRQPSSRLFICFSLFFFAQCIYIRGCFNNTKAEEPGTLNTVELKKKKTLLFLQIEHNKHKSRQTLWFFHPTDVRERSKTGCEGDSKFYSSKQSIQYYTVCKNKSRTEKKGPEYENGFLELKQKSKEIKCVTFVRAGILI